HSTDSFLSPEESVFLYSIVQHLPLQDTANMDISRDATGEDITTPPVRKETGNPQKRLIHKPVIKVLPSKETKNNEEVSTSSDTGTIITRRRHETSSSNKSDNDD